MARAETIQQNKRRNKKSQNQPPNVSEFSIVSFSHFSL